MKIAFWSTQRGRNGVTSNLACTSVLSNIYHPRRAILFENHQNINNLGNVLIRQPSHDILHEQKLYQGNCGLEHLLRQMEQDIWINEDMLIQSSVSILKQNLFYIPRSSRTNQEYLEFELNQHLNDLLNITENFCETSYIDTGVISSMSSQKILGKADVIVVNLSQNPHVLEHFFRNFTKIRKKAFYLIANYEDNSMFSKEYIMKKYRIHSKQIGIIPHHMGFADAMSEGRLISFLQSNYSCNSNSIHYEFIARAKETVQLFESFANAINRIGKIDSYKERR